jgi:protocatechuate 3,4-dioxygenase beta subunit
MKPLHPAHLTRRTILRAWLALPAAYILAACTGQSSATTTPEPTLSAQATGTAPAATATTPASAPPSTATVTPSAAATAATAPQATPIAPPATQATAANATATAAAQAVVLTPTPECGDDDDDPTPAQTEGPYYTPNTPERASLLEAGMAGTKLILTGSVLTTGCAPVARALIDFWQADNAGVYDNSGFRLRGHQFTDVQGRYRLETVVPGLYPGRTRHIHVKVQAPNRPVLTTQLYFPGEARNASDGIYREELLVAMRDVAAGKEAAFDFVLNIS